jgi:hypothetical protein
VIASNWAIPVTTTWGFNFLINSINKSDWRGASITVTVPSAWLLSALPWNFKKKMWVLGNNLIHDYKQRYWRESK